MLSIRMNHSVNSQRKIFRWLFEKIAERCVQAELASGAATDPARLKWKANDMNSVNSRKKWFLITIGLLIAFAVLGQTAIDKIAHDSEAGQYWGYERGLPYLGITIAVTCATVGVIYLAVRSFPMGKKALRVLAWVLGIAMAGWMLLFLYYYIYVSSDPGDVYGAAGLWIAHVDKLQTEREIWDKTHWYGQGDDVYAYSFDEYLKAYDHLYLGNEDEEPYHSIVDEREKIEYVFQYCESDTMINVLTYFYGRWVWLLYTLIVIAMLGFAISLLPTAGKTPGKLLYLTAWVSFAVISIMPALNGCAFLYNFWGPPFTGYGFVYREFNILLTGPAAGVMLGLADQKKERPCLSTNTGGNRYRRGCGTGY